MQQETLRAQKRVSSGSRPARRLRREGQVPAIVYGRDLDTVSLRVSDRDLYSILHTEAGLNALINLEIEDGGSVLTVAREVQRDPVRGDITHLDFIKVSLDEEIEAEVSLQLVGTPIGVREDQGLVEAIETTLMIRALPTQIPNAVELDIADLSVGDGLKVADLPQIEGVTYLADEEAPLVTILAPTVVEEEVAEELLEGLEGEEVEGVEGEAPDAEAPDAEAAEEADEA
jgi:large subunit ribosomal protein L25